jgi:hypothetical protein
MKTLLLALGILMVGCSEPTVAEQRLQELEEELRNNPPDTTGNGARMAQYLQDREAEKVRWEIPGFAGCDATSASTVAEHYVSNNLKSPSQASFAPHNDANVKNDGSRITYVGYVDAPNSYNAVQRMFFKVWMECRDGGLVVVDVKFE